jgi:hypothetical protein
MDIEMRWKDLLLYTRPRGKDEWSCVGGITFHPVEWPRWFWGWLMPKRWLASRGQRIEAFMTFAEAKAFMEGRE